MLPAPVDGSAPGYFGVYPAFVTDLVDPDSLGRIEVRFPFLGTDGDRDVRAWATLCTPYADADSGLEILPEVGSQVVVAFEAGQPPPSLHRRLRLERQGGTAARTRRRRTTSGCCARGRTAGWSSTTTTPRPRSRCAHAAATRWSSTRAPAARSRSSTPRAVSSGSPRHRSRSSRNLEVTVNATDRRGDRADLHVQRHGQGADVHRRLVRHLAGLHPGRREHLVTEFALRAPWYVAGAGRDRPARPGARCVRRSRCTTTPNFVRRITTDPRDSLAFDDTFDDVWTYPVPVKPVWHTAEAGSPPGSSSPPGCASCTSPATTASTPSWSRCSATSPGCPGPGSHDDIEVGFVMRRQYTAVSGPRGPKRHVVMALLKDLSDQQKLALDETAGGLRDARDLWWADEAAHRRRAEDHADDIRQLDVDVTGAGLVHAERSHPGALAPGAAQRPGAGGGDLPDVAAAGREDDCRGCADPLHLVRRDPHLLRRALPGPRRDRGPSSTPTHYTRSAAS